MSHENDNQKKTSGASGIQKAVPVILAGVAAFIAFCLIFGETGILGNGVSSVLRGIFASGAYAVPLLLLAHALFFKEDVANKNLLSRIVFSLVAILIVSSIDYAITGLVSDPAYDPQVFYTEKSSGGFIGGTISFLLAKLISYVGIIILDATVIIAYVIVFFGKKQSTARRGILGFLQFFASGLAKAEGKIKKNAEEKKEAKAEARRQETERRHSEFLDDQFFDTDGNMDELKISELGIHETKKKGRSESRPILQTKVHNKSALSKEDIEKERCLAEESSKRKDSGLDFNIPTTDNKRSSDAGQVFFAATDKSFTEKHNTYGIDENADSVFTKDFDPFDFATGERLVAKASTKAQPTPAKMGGNGFITPLSSVTEKSIADQKRREEFEARKRSIIERNAAIKNESSSQTPATATSLASESTAADKPESHVIEPKTIERTASIATMLKAQPAADDSVTMEFGSSKEAVDGLQTDTIAENQAMATDLASTEELLASAPDDKNAYEEIAERVLKNNPAYAVSANRSTFTTTIKTDSDSVNSIESTVNSETTDTAVQDTPIVEEAAFKPYTPPTPDISAASVSTAETILVTERTLVTSASDTDDEFLKKEIERYSEIDSDEEAEPDISAEINTDTITEVKTEEDSDMSFYPQITQTAEVQINDTEFVAKNAMPAAAAAVINETAEKETVFTFGDDEEADAEESVAASGDIEEIFGTPDEETDADSVQEPIPPEEQNPEVIKQRAMFPFLDEEDTELNEDSSDVQAESADEVPEAILEPQTTNYGTNTEAEQLQDYTSDTDQEDLIIDNEPDELGAEDDEPPFDVEEEDVSAALVPAVEKPKKKDYSDFVFPPIDLLHSVDEKANENVSEEIQDNADKLIDTLASFGVTASIKGVDRGPRITRYEVVPAKGVKVSQIMNLADDIALNLAADGIRMEAPIPGKSAVGVEIPNKKSSIVRLRELIETDDFKSYKSKTTVCMGKDVAGQPVFADVAKMPHALIAGATGMGKSVCINSLMLSILYKARPDEVKFIMIDPKQVEFTMYNGIPHLLVPVVTDVKQAAGTLMWAVEEMERRYGVLQEQCVRNIDAYNEKIASNSSLGEPMSRIVIVIDEFAELIMQAKNPVESLIIRIAQKARAAGIHLIIGTQKPVKEVITGLIKSNIPSKLSCKVASNRDSILIFDAAGAEKLLDRGDMLIAFANSLKPQRVQCAFVADEEVEAVMDYLKQYSDGSSYDESVMEEIKRAADKCAKKGGGDRDDDDGDDSSYGEGYLNNKEFLDAVEIAVNTRKISTSLIQRKLSVGYGKAAKFIDVMEDMGVVGEANGSKPREVLLSADEWHEKLARTTYD